MGSVPVIFTMDLEDDQGSYQIGARFEQNTYRLLDALAERNIRGTVFTVGRVAESCPTLIRRVAGLGHEVACHSWDHTTIDKQTPAEFRAATAHAKDSLEQAAGAEVLGYRAPLFSLIPGTAWAAEELKSLGFGYSSSVLPARNPVYGFPNASRRPFRWPCGLPEFPVPIVGLGPWGVPYLGGIYIRYLPLSMVLLMARWNSATLTQWTYVHPYDFDPVSRPVRRPDQPMWRYWAQRYNRGSALRKLLAVLTLGQGLSMAQITRDPQFLSSLEVGPVT